MARTDPVYIVGITQRSGTHYLYDLLVRHPQCRAALRRTSWEGSWEDHLLEYAPMLIRYVDAVTSSNRFYDAESRRLMLERLGGALESFVRDLDHDSGDERRPVTKTPMSANAECAFVLWPHATLLLLVRDPRAVVASALHTFGGTAETWIREWRRGARRFIELVRTHPSQCVLVRYEELFADTERVLRHVFDRLDLEADRYDFAGLAELPVRGSAQLGGARRETKWFPVQRTADFDPVRRGAWLSPQTDAQIRWLAMDEMRALGYAHDDDARPDGVQAAACTAATTVYAVRKGWERITAAAATVRQR